MSRFSPGNFIITQWNIGKSSPPDENLMSWTLIWKSHFIVVAHWQSFRPQNKRFGNEHVTRKTINDCIITWVGIIEWKMKRIESLQVVFISNVVDRFVFLFHNISLELGRNLLFFIDDVTYLFEIINCYLLN